MKASGTLADANAVAALAALQMTESNDFHDLGATWCSCLFLRHSVYRRRKDGAVFVSLGFNKWIALGWQLSEVEGADCTFFETPSQQDARSSLQFLCLTNVASNDDSMELEEFEAIPVEPRFLVFLDNIFVRT